MSRSNIDKPFYVDIGTSIVAVRCNSNRDVLQQFDHVRYGKWAIERAEWMCDRMNKEIDNFLPTEIATLRAIVKELADGLSRVMRVSKWCDCGCDDCEEQNNCNSKKMRELVAKAREVCNESEVK